MRVRIYVNISTVVVILIGSVGNASKVLKIVVIVILTTKFGVKFITATKITSMQ